jgi:4-hydroxyphenylpyruvate dioxygenase
MAPSLFCLLSCCTLLAAKVSALSMANPVTTPTSTWTPKIASLEERRKLRGLQHESERIGSLGFHHIEFFCGDAKSTANQFSSALGMKITGTTGQQTGNDQCISYGLESGHFKLLLTAPYSKAMSSKGGASSSDNDNKEYDAPNPLPNYSPDQAHEFFQRHGLAARAIGLHVKDAKAAFDASVANGAEPVLDATFIPTCRGQLARGATSQGCFMSEVKLYGDVVLRYVSFDSVDGESITSDNLPFLPHLAVMEGKLAERETFGIYGVDHAVGNVPNLKEAHDRIAKFTGFHEFAEFTAQDVGTVDSGLNSVVLASDSEAVLLPLNEPTAGKYVHVPARQGLASATDHLTHLCF